MKRYSTPFRILSIVLIIVMVGSFSLTAFPMQANAQAPVTVVSSITGALNLIKTTITAAFSGTTAGATTAAVPPAVVTSGASVAGASAGGITAVTSVNTLAKNNILDPIAWAVSKAVLQSVVNSTVNWINHGFNGSPGFVTNLPNTLQAVGDTAANNFISQLATNGSINSPFQTQIANAVSTNYLQSSSAGGFFTQNAFTLNQASPNPTAFLAGNFSQGGWNAFMSAIINPQNNPYGAYSLATAAVGQQVAGAQSTQKTELNWGQGFLSSRGSCPTSTTGKSTTGVGGSTSLSQNSTCLSAIIQTPGTVISGQLNKALGTGNDTLVSAHEIDELVNALLGQLTKAVIGPGGGLGGLSQSSASTGNTTYFAQTDPSESAISSTLGTSFGTTITGQLTSVQQFQSSWNIINNAAQGALAALSANSCSANQAETTNVVQPVISQAAAALSQASSSIASLQNIENELPNPNSTADQTTVLSQASNDYSNISSTLPTTLQISYAQAQSIDNSATLTESTSTPPTLLTQMNQIAQSAPSCQAVPSTQTSACQAATATYTSSCAFGTTGPNNTTTPTCQAAVANLQAACNTSSGTGTN